MAVTGWDTHSQLQEWGAGRMVGRLGRTTTRHQARATGTLERPLELLCGVGDYF